MIGACEAEAASSGTGQKLADAYGINAEDDAASRKAAIEFMGDARFGWPAMDLTERLGNDGKDVYRFVFDQVNPFAKTNAIAHHGVDLFAVFAGYDDVVGDEMKAVGHKFRSNWIEFANGGKPWDAGKVFAYGAKGQTGEISDEEVATRRRVKQFEVLKEVGLDTYQEIWWALRSAGTTAVQ